MSMHRTILVLALLIIPLVAASEELILPAFALNAAGSDGSRWSTEVYLVNPAPQPVQVSITGLLPGRVRRSAPCGGFMTRTRVVPAHSAVLWTASGLATDLGCADEVIGALTLHADGPVQVTGRLVHHANMGEMTPSGVLSGGGQAVNARSTAELPGPATLLLPALLWHRNSCGEVAFTADVGFANPGGDPVAVTLDLPGESRRAIRVNGRTVSLPHRLIVEPGRWSQIRLSPTDRPGAACLDPESFDLVVSIDGSLAVYGSVVDRLSLDGRMVEPVELN